MSVGTEPFYQLREGLAPTVISAFFELLHFVEPWFSGLHTVCRFPLLSRFLAPTSHCLAGQCPSFPVCCILCRWAAKKLSVIRPHAVQNTARLYVRNFHYPTPVRIFPTAFLPSHMGLLCLLYDPNSPPVLEKCDRVWPGQCSRN